MIAKGIEVVDSRTRRRYIVSAKREVILSAGALLSPQLLMLSGIGPAEHLKDKGIPVVSKSKVKQTRDIHFLRDEANGNSARRFLF